MLGYDRYLKSNTAKRRTHSLFRQGCMLYELIPTMPEVRLSAAAPGCGEDLGEEPAKGLRRRRAEEPHVKRFVLHPHATAGRDWRECRDFVRERLGLLPPFTPGKAHHRPPPLRARNSVEGAPPDRIEHSNGEVAAWLWSRRKPVSETSAAGLYLRNSRHYHGTFPPTLGYLPANGTHHPAMIAAFGLCDEPAPGILRPPAAVHAVHITRLTEDGNKADVEAVKIMLGAMSGLPIMLAPINDGLGVAISEGIEDGLSVAEETGLGVWAAGSAGNMPKIAAALPGYVACVTLFAHLDNGLRFAKEAASIIRSAGIEVHLKGRKGRG